MGPRDTRPIDGKIAKITIFDEIDGDLIEEAVIDGVISSLSIENSCLEENAPPQVTVTLETTSIKHTDHAVNEKRIYRKVGELVPELFNK